MAAIIGAMVNNRRKERIYRNFTINMDIDEIEMRRRYRFGPNGIELITQLIGNELERNTSRSRALTVREQVFLALRYYASGSFMQVVGDSTGRDKATVSRVIADVTDSLVVRADQYVKWPSQNQQMDIMREFYSVFGFPHVIGAVDGSHVRILMPKDGNEFINRKNFPSINVMAVCDSKGRFIFIDARWPGSSHDSFVYRASDVSDHLEARNRSWTDGILVGDSGYACSRVLMTPYRTPDNQRKLNFNRALSRTRVAIEMTFGRWKRRFGILHGELRLKPVKASRVIMACVVLHNLAININEPDVDGAVPVAPQPNDDYRGREEGQAIREHITRVTLPKKFICLPMSPTC